VHLAVPFTPQYRARPQVRCTGQLHGALPGVLRRHRTVEQTLALAVQITKRVSLKAVSQNTKQEVAGQVRVRPPPEYGMPTVSKSLDVEITQARNLDVECVPVRQCRTDPYARHGAQDDWRLDLRGPSLALSTPGIW
jgi:hypothetical protein